MSAGVTSRRATMGLVRLNEIGKLRFGSGSFKLGLVRFGKVGLS